MTEEKAVMSRGQEKAKEEEEMFGDQGAGGLHASGAYFPALEIN